MQEFDLEYYCPPSFERWRGRLDNTNKNERFFQFVNLASLNINIESFWHLALIGFCCDEGVKRNFGRI